MTVGCFTRRLMLGLFVITSSGCAHWRTQGRVVDSGRRGLLDGARAGERAGERARSDAQLDRRAPAGREITESRREFPDQPDQQDRQTQGARATLSREEEWQWPVERPRVTSPFGARGRRFHEGVDLEAPVGTPVFAAQSGEVVYAGSKIHGYGRLLVIKHDDGVLSLYAHNSRLLVREGARVERGTQVAVSGRSGRVRGPHVHFEIRRGVIALDPASLLPVVR